VNDPESAVYDPAGFPYSVNFSSGGGFSNVYPVPAHNPPYPYYSGLVADTGDIQTLPDVAALAGSTGGIYNRIGRGVPDVAAVGDNIAVSLIC
jgi:tripeptidyl-peptidase-1